MWTEHKGTRKTCARILLSTPHITFKKKSSAMSTLINLSFCRIANACIETTNKQTDNELIIDVMENLSHSNNFAA